MSDWLKMGGYGLYVWGSYGMLALAIVVELWSLGRHRRRAALAIEQAAEESHA